MVQYSTDREDLIEVKESLFSTIKVLSIFYIALLGRKLMGVNYFIGGTKGTNL